MPQQIKIFCKILNSISKINKLRDKATLPKNILKKKKKNHIKSKLKKEQKIFFKPI